MGYATLSVRPRHYAQDEAFNDPRFTAWLWHHKASPV